MKSSWKKESNYEESLSVAALLSAFFERTARNSGYGNKDKRSDPCVAVGTVGTVGPTTCRETV